MTELRSPGDLILTGCRSRRCTRRSPRSCWRRSGRAGRSRSTFCWGANSSSLAASSGVSPPVFSSRSPPWWGLYTQHGWVEAERRQRGSSDYNKGLCLLPVAGLGCCRQGDRGSRRSLRGRGGLESPRTRRRWCQRPLTELESYRPLLPPSFKSRYADCAASFWARARNVIFCIKSPPLGCLQQTHYKINMLC